MQSRETVPRTKNNLHANLNGNRYGLQDKSSSTHFKCKYQNLCAIGKKYKVVSRLEQRNGNTAARNYSNNMRKYGREQFALV